MPFTPLIETWSMVKYNIPCLCKLNSELGTLGRHRGLLTMTLFYHVYKGSYVLIYPCYEGYQDNIYSVI